MRIRIKFAKRGQLKFIGHLDTMRYFQKLIRRAGIDIAYSEGFNPHQKLSFAQPLGVGMPSEGEYADIEVNTTYTSAEAIERLNAANAEGFEILSYRLLGENAGNAMASVAAADYRIAFREGYEPDGFDFLLSFDKFFNGHESIMVLKETKKSTAEMDIKPYIYKYCGDGDTITVTLSAGSVTNIKPELLMDAFSKSLGLDINEFTFIYMRLELYGTDKDGGLIPLMDFGEDI